MLAPAFALAALLIATMIFESAVPTPVVNSTPESGMDCYCHKDLSQQAKANNTDVSAFFPHVTTGGTFSLRVQIQFSNLNSMGSPDSITWIADMDENSKFQFNPNQIVDNSAQDQSAGKGEIVGLFRITAPQEAGRYVIAFTYRDFTSEIYVTVGQSASLSYAAITNINGPLAAKPGDDVRMNITLLNNGTQASKFYVYATNSSSRKIVFEKIYSQTPIESDATTSLIGTFKMPDGNLTLVIHSGHVEDTGDFDDSRVTIYMFQALNVAPIAQVPYSVLAIQWAPWIAIAGASLGSVPILATRARKRKPLFPKAEKLKLAIVDCAICGGCEIAIADLGEHILNLMSTKIELVYAPILMSAREYGPVDAAFVVGAVRNAEDLRIVKEARQKAKILVAFGTCPGFGGLNNLANLSSKQELLETAFVNAPSMLHDGKTIPSERVPELIGEIRPLSEYMKVDIIVPGCPPPAQAIRDTIETLLNGFSNGANRK
jgi:Ni,Fe-hydrogenase III small subunit